MKASVPYTERDGSEFVRYEGFSIEYRDASHRYWIHAKDERKAVASVTTALSVLNRPALVGWAERMGAEGALTLERAGSLGGVAIHEAVDRIRQAKMGADARRDAGADRGTAVHDAIRYYLITGQAPVLSDFAEEVRGYVSSACAWLVRNQPQPILVERIIGYPEHEYAGRLDLIADIDGMPTLYDWKTNEKGRVYDEAHTQCAAYLGALPICGIDGVLRAKIVAFGDGTKPEEVDCEADLADFISVLDTYRRMNRVASGRRARERDQRGGTEWKAGVSFAAKQ